MDVSVAVAGAGLSLQWFKDSIAVPGATNALLTILSCSTNDAGSYYIIASNAISSARSSNAVIIVDPVEAKNFLRMGQYWRYNASGIDLGSVWKDPGFDDSSWPAGPGVLAVEEDRSIAPLIRTALPLRNAADTKINTYYFRTHFDWSQPAAGGYLVVTNLIDDGAVIYLNGTELFRFHMPTGIVRYTNEASSPAIANATFIRTNVSASLLVSGDNVLAAEVHQFGANSSDLVFGLTLTIEPLPRLEFTRGSGEVNLSWNDPQFEIQSSTNITGAWTTAGTNISTLRVSLTNSARFFRLRR